MKSVNAVKSMQMKNPVEESIFLITEDDKITVMFKRKNIKSYQVKPHWSRSGRKPMRGETDCVEFRCIYREKGRGRGRVTAVSELRLWMLESKSSNEIK